MVITVDARRKNASRRRRAIATALPVLGALSLLAVYAGPASAVADGTAAAEGQYPFTAKLTMTNIPRSDGSTYNSACTAVLIAPQWVMTAGHCFHDENLDPVSGEVRYQTTATIGRTDDADTTTGAIEQVIEDFQAPAGDISIGKLADPVEGITPLALAQTAPAVGDIVRIAGFGSLSDANPTPATHLQTGQFTVSGVSDTVVTVDGYAPTVRTSACAYDSGAPYFAETAGGEPLLVSVESNGPSCPHTGGENTARVDTIASWAEQTMAAN